jgi:hypothetical protein
MGPIQPHIQWVPIYIPGIKSVDHSPPNTAKVKNDWSYTSTPPLRFRGVDREKCTFFTFF